MINIDESLKYQLRQYATLLIKRGVTLEQGQLLVITCHQEQLYFATILTEVAYTYGAGDVQIRLEDEQLEHMKNRYANEQFLLQDMQRKAEMQLHFNEQDACFIRLLSPRFLEMEPIDDHRLKLLTDWSAKVASKNLSSQFAFVNRRQAAPVATYSWAAKLFPHLSVEQGIQELWKQILYITYSDGVDAVAAWDQHIEKLLSDKVMLQQLGIKELHFRNEMGTDLHIKLAEEYMWYGGYAIDAKGNRFYPSIPTEEIFTAPHRYQVSGVVFNSIPLVYDGQLIDKFWLKFAGGKVVEWHAEIGAELLETILQTDEGASYLGEIALVSSDSRMAERDMLYYETLCDENRTCHLALGMGYPGCIKGELSISQKQEKGLNVSSVHVDFMFGTSDMIVNALLSSGEHMIVMQDGNFCF